MERLTDFAVCALWSIPFWALLGAAFVVGQR